MKLNAKKYIQRLAKKYSTPQKVQAFLRAMPYNREKKIKTLRSAYSALKAGTAHCFEASFIAALLLEQNGYPTTVMSFESQDGLDHVIFVFQKRGLWGAVARSRDEGLHGRKPVYKSLRDLAWSYYDPYVDKTGKITAFQLANLDESNSDWRYSSRNVWKAENYLLELPHRKLKSSKKYYQKLHSRYLKHGPMPKQKNWW